MFERHEPFRSGIEINQLNLILKFCKMQFLKKFSVFRFQNKTSANGQPLIKSSITLDSDISGIECKFLKQKYIVDEIENKIVIMIIQMYLFRILFQPRTITHFHLNWIQRLIQAIKFKIQTQHWVIC